MIYDIEEGAEENREREREAIIETSTALSTSAGLPRKTLVSHLALRKGIKNTDMVGRAVLCDTDWHSGIIAFHKEELEEQEGQVKKVCFDINRTKMYLLYRKEREV